MSADAAVAAPLPETPEEVGARARERVAHNAKRRPVVPVIATPLLRQEPAGPRRYAPHVTAASPSVTWEASIAPDAGEPWDVIVGRCAAACEGMARRRVTRPGGVAWPELRDAGEQAGGRTGEAWEVEADGATWEKSTGRLKV